jgi:hypothetical protein
MDFQRLQPGGAGDMVRATPPGRWINRRRRRGEMSDIFKEVDEDLRRDQFRKLWDQFGPYVIGVAVFIVVATAGFRGWEYWQEKQAQATGDRFLAALDLANQGKHEDAIAALKAIEANGSGRYPVLAGFRVASEMAATGDTKGALAEYDAIAARGDMSDSIKALARLRAGALLVDTMSLADLEKRLSDLAGTGNVWRHNARELLGLTAWRTGDYDAARKYFNEIDNDQEAPADLRQRAEVMLSLIAARIGEPPAPAKS